MKTLLPVYALVCVVISIQKKIITTIFWDNFKNELNLKNEEDSKNAHNIRMRQRQQ